MDIRPMLIDHYDEVYKLWLDFGDGGVTVRDDADSRECISRFLGRNPGLSSVALVDGHVIGAVLCGHDGRRGCMYHLVVARHHRGRGVAQALVERCLAELESGGITGFQVYVWDRAEEAIRFWKHLGWTRYDGLSFLVPSCTSTSRQT